MKTYLKVALAVTGGVVGVGGGATTTLTLRKSSSQYGVSTTGGGEQSLSSLSSADESQRTIAPDTSAVVTERVSGPENSSSTEVDSLEETTFPPPVTPVKEEKKENCSIIDSQSLDDVFYYLLESKSYVLISCKDTDKNINSKWSSPWAGLFPSELFLDKSTGSKFKLVTETESSSDSDAVTFSSEAFSSSAITGKEDSMLRAQRDDKQFLLQTINLTSHKSEKSFLIFNENFEILKQIINF
ncbi:hypothetical protein DNK47_02675 [Mycoplasma wenyonii]|uniref:Uncharacterized protein n=1 Tax=Mycoplasma wenyonii TaxID=65123 RepID=A0A328PPD1_9MOLU|nr:hypothetical protein [Mycoplasma wenyonii]RAO94878.1 hypothetical protein DNK47_02675 [Mycoplasma wenyonii]